MTLFGEKVSLELVKLALNKKVLDSILLKNCCKYCGMGLSEMCKKCSERIKNSKCYPLDKIHLYEPLSKARMTVLHKRKLGNLSFKYGILNSKIK